MKCYIIDAGFSRSRDSSGLGMVIRNWEGLYIAGRTIPMAGQPMVKKAEALGLLEALKCVMTLIRHVYMVCYL